MHRVSTNLTLFYKFFIPVFWIVFCGAVTVAVLFYPFTHIGNLPASYFRIGVLFVYSAVVAALAFTFLRLKRVETDEDFFYVTNYFKAARYPYHNIEKIVVRHFFLFRTVSLNFKEPGIFGRRATFIPSKQRFHDFWEANPQLRERLLVEK